MVVRWTRRLVLAVLVAVVALLGVFYLGTRTHAGQTVALEQLLKRLQGALNGRIRVGDVRSGDLLHGVTLYDVEIVGADDRPFFRADTVRATYAWRSFLAGDLVFSGLTVFGPDLRLTRYPGEETFNVDRIVRTGEETDTAAGAPRRVVFDDVRLVDGTVEVLYPAPEATPTGASPVLVPSPVGEGRLRRLRFDDIDADLPRAVVASTEVEGPEVAVAALSLVGQVYEEPFRLVDMAGRVTWIDGLLTVSADRVRLPGTRVEGQVVANFRGDEGLVVSLDVDTPEASLADLQWLEPRLPDGTARGHLTLAVTPEATRFGFRGFHADLGASAVDVDGEVALRDGSPAFDELSLRLAPVDVDLLDPWLEAELPVTGTVRGDVRLDGPLDRLRARGRLTLRQPGTDTAPTTADFQGVFHLAGGFGVTDLRATLDPLDWGLVRQVAPEVELAGSGRLQLEATGRLEDGLRFDAEAVHVPPGAPRSRILARGSVRSVGDDYVVDVHADVSPLSLTALRASRPALPLTGEVSGSIRAVGPLSDLRITTNLDTEAGRLDLESRLDVRNPGAAYSFEGQVEAFRVSALVPDLPDPTVLTGYVNVQGHGLDPATADARVRLRAHDSRVGGLMVDTVRAAFTVDRGVFRVDTLDGVAGGIAARGEGTLALEAGGPAGEIHVAFRSDSLGPLRPLLVGDTVIARDDLSVLDRELLIAQGVDPDTLPTRAEVALGGTVAGDIYLRGSVEDFAAEGEAEFTGLRYGSEYVESARVAFSATRLPSLEGELHAEIRADSVQVLDRAFAGGELDVDYTRPGGRFDLFLSRTGEEDYRARAVFEVDTLGGRVELDELTLRFDTLRWSLEEPAAVAWDGSGVQVDHLALSRPGPSPMSIRVDGNLPREGAADFTVELEDVRLGRLADLVQREDLEAAGVVDLSLRVTGTAEAPVIAGTVDARDLAWEDWSLDRLEGRVDYRDRQVALDLGAWRDERHVLTVRGTVPADLALTEVAERFPEGRELDVAVTADSLAAAFALGFLPDLEDVEGAVSADFRIQGTVADPEPTGTLVLEDAAWTIAAIGVRQDVRGSLTLNRDATVNVDAVVRAGGTARVTGLLRLDPLTDPGFDLEMVFDQFLAVDRRDVTGNVSGDVTLTGSYQKPVVRGLRQNNRGLRVDRGVLFLEEFLRSATVVDLSDPRFFDVVDTTAVRARPLIADSQNPFLNNLRVEVDLAVERDTWLRSPDLNVEIGGSLVVTYDRGSRDLVLVGDLEALRGSYTLLGRRFEVEEGQVGFVGTPGINPNLDIQARTRIRRSGGEPLEILATVSGTLVDPHVQLSSDEEAIAESDLVSYLIFGRPSYELASGSARLVQEGAAGSLIGSAAGAGLSVFSGTVYNRLSSLVAQQWGLEYFAINQPGGLDIGSLAGSVAQTTVEAGWYLTEDLFTILVLRPLSNLGGSSSTSVMGGVRLEWRATDAYRVEAFYEDRFLRTRAFGFQELGFKTDWVGGFLVVWEWGY